MLNTLKDKTMKKNWKNLNIQDLLADASPEQMIVWNYIFLRFGDNVAIQQYYFKNAQTTEPLTYALGRMFFAYEFYASVSVGAFAAQPTITFNDEADANFLILSNTTAYFNVAAAFSGEHIYARNILFSRYTVNNYALPCFWGFRIIYQ